MAVVVIAIIVAVITYIGHENVAGGVSSAGASNSTAKLASVTMAPALAAGTTTGILNTDGTDRQIIDSFVSCTNTGSSLPYLTGLTSGSLSAWGVAMSTSTGTGVGLGGNLNYASNLTIATTSPWAYTASTTLGVGGVVGLIWPTNTYLNIVFNATNTAACTVGVHYLSL